MNLTKTTPYDRLGASPWSGRYRAQHLISVCHLSYRDWDPISHDPSFPSSARPSRVVTGRCRRRSYLVCPPGQGRSDLCGVVRTPCPAGLCVPEGREAMVPEGCAGRWGVVSQIHTSGRQTPAMELGGTMQVGTKLQ